ncbi:asparagine synthase (glutamine-hydrolyzing) [uncultured Desulfuromusa sp.]|uniref:asparagine synthase (glutamine-hydrolyzing) n=1 Tax=uncultured Desulfuromusa sp. TaxID=219183 RepID=UPI002AA8CED3|nr:asparagine synthase (glutamine-hydrolyzing) [uncultured Desulfuromusa sp.]
MCGVVGVYHRTSSVLTSDVKAQELARVKVMLEPLKLRGPDEQNVVSFGSTVLGHTRLSIIDLSTGSQPVYNEDKSVAVVFNGEVYNFEELRDDLRKKGHVFQSRSDTEVIVHLYEELGEALFTRLDGMFAILLHDKKRDLFIAARDRMGEKPLLYWENEEKIIVSSELKSLLCYPELKREVCQDALALFFKTMYIPAPHCIVSGVQKLPPSSYLLVKEGKISVKKYWEPVPSIDWNLSEHEVVETFTSIFSNSVSSRMIADVPLGVFLSGGIDSSAVTAFMARHCSSPIKTFTVGFADEVDERPYARRVAEQYGTKHTELYIDDKVEDVISEIMQYYDEPFGDSSAIPTYLVSREARKHVKVVLTGDGGDELFAGYGSYLNQRHLLDGRFATKAFETANHFLLNRLNLPWLDSLYSKGSNPRAQSHWLGVRTIMFEKEISELMGRYDGGSNHFFQGNKWLNFKDQDPLTVAFAHDLNFYLPDDLLKKVDMASMKASLECRAPFLDHHLVEFAMKIPPQMKVKGGELKYLIKKSLQPYLPNEILYRHKTGFGAPVSSWMRGQLREMVSDLLQPGCHAEMYLNRRVIDDIFSDFYQANSQDFRLPFKLWLIFIFELWLRDYMTPTVEPL